MSVWFEGAHEIACDMQAVKDALERPGEYFLQVVGHMPGLSQVELVDHGADFVTIRTNEGLMERTNITKRAEAERFVIECDEVYQAGRMVTARSHFLEDFRPSDTGVTHRLVISDVEAPGVLGFFYRTFARASIGKAFLAAAKTCFEG